ncbi:MAG: hypothetical protein AB1610_00040 [Nitrospirota bacterium]
MDNLDIYTDLIGKLESKIEEILKNQDRVLISVVGKRGTGKSYFGKYIRKKGVGKFSNRMISVIDDGLIWLEFLHFFRRRVKIRCSGVDELKPFLDKLTPRKKIIFYLNATPWPRISRADILLKFVTDEDTRIKRLQKRYKDKPLTLDKAVNIEDIEDYKIKYTYFLEAKV